MRHILSMDDLSVKDIKSILADAKSFSALQKGWTLSTCRLVANLFFEPSTRTQYSFMSAQNQLGCKVVNFAPENSSLTKGESLYDTVKTFEAIGYEAVVIRHPQQNYFESLSSLSIPILNAGDGSGNHPSQCLLDLYTIHEEFGYLEGLKVVIVGDIVHSRVAHSHLNTLKRFNVEVKLSGPPQFIEYPELYISMDEAVAWADVVMLLRVQRERHQQELPMTAQAYLQQYGLTKARYNQLQSHAIVMHPAPVNRGVEIDGDLVESEKSRIFKQMENGVCVRKAMMKYVFEEEF